MKKELVLALVAVCILTYIVESAYEILKHR
jgi:hypothetical protein